MTDENLGQVLDDDIAEFRRNVTIINLGKRGYLTIGQLAQLVAHDQHGATVKGITLQELLDVQKRIEAGEDVTPTPPQKATPAKAAKKPSAKKAAKKTAAAPKPAAPKPAAPKPAKKPAAKKPAAKKVAKKATTAPKKAAAKKPASSADDKKGPKADKGKPKPRLDYSTGTKEVYAAIKAAGAPMGRSDIEKTTGYTGVQVRAFCKKLKDEGKIDIQGTGGRSTLYALASN